MGQPLTDLPVRKAVIRAYLTDTMPAVAATTLSRRAAVVSACAASKLS